jgi:hypothetical protein
MSTKTAFKRVALVAAAALAIGGLSSVAANAAGTATFSGTGITGGATAVVTAVTGTYQPITITFTGDTNNADSVTSTGVGQVNVPSIAAGASVFNVATTGITASSFTAFEADSSSSVPGTSANTLSTTGAGNAFVGTLNISAYSATAGTQIITVNGSGGASTLTITWGAAPVFSASNSTAYIKDGAATALLTVDAATPTADRYLG